jgi:hypothetical protein
MALELNKRYNKQEILGSSQEELRDIFGKKGEEDAIVEEDNNSSYGKKSINGKIESLEKIGNCVSEETKKVLEDRLLREPIKFKTDTAIQAIVENMYDWMRITKRQNFWDTVIAIGKDNLPNNPMKDLVFRYASLRVLCPQISTTDIVPVVDLNRHGRTYQLNLYLKMEQIGIISDIKRGYFIKPPIHPDVPYIMLIVSFIYSKYGNDMMEPFRDSVKQFYDTMLANIRGLEISIYNLNISVLTNGRFFIPPHKIHFWIEYLNYLVKYFDEKNDFNNPDIMKQIELITDYCEYVNTYMELFRRENAHFNDEEFGKLYGWTKAQKISRNPKIQD